MVVPARLTAKPALPAAMLFSAPVPRMIEDFPLRRRQSVIEGLQGGMAGLQALQPRAQHRLQPCVTLHHGAAPRRFGALRGTTCFLFGAIC